jgi:hypothetical protein
MVKNVAKNCFDAKKWQKCSVALKANEAFGNVAFHLMTR